MFCYCQQQQQQQQQQNEQVGGLGLLQSIRLRPTSPQRIVPIDQAINIYETAITYIEKTKKKLQQQQRTQKPSMVEKQEEEAVVNGKNNNNNKNYSRLGRYPDSFDASLESSSSSSVDIENDNNIVDGWWMHVEWPDGRYLWTKADRLQYTTSEIRRKQKQQPTRRRSTGAGTIDGQDQDLDDSNHREYNNDYGLRTLEFTTYSRPPRRSRRRRWSRQSRHVHNLVDDVTRDHDNEYDDDSDDIERIPPNLLSSLLEHKNRDLPSTNADIGANDNNDNDDKRKKDQNNDTTAATTTTAPARSSIIEFGNNKSSERSGRYGARESYHYTVKQQQERATRGQRQRQGQRRKQRWWNSNFFSSSHDNSHTILTRDASSKGHDNAASSTTNSDCRVRYTRYGEAPVWYGPNRMCMLELSGRKIYEGSSNDHQSNMATNEVLQKQTPKFINNIIQRHVPSFWSILHPHHHQQQQQQHHDPHGVHHQAQQQVQQHPQPIHGHEPKIIQHFRGRIGIPFRIVNNNHDDNDDRPSTNKTGDDA